jgi:hypothetical protein
MAGPAIRRGVIGSTSDFGSDSSGSSPGDGASRTHHARSQRDTTAFPSHVPEEKSNAQPFFVIDRSTPLQVLINSNKTQGFYKC